MLAAPKQALRRSATLGGIFPDLRAGRLREAARRVHDIHGGDLARSLRSDPAGAARALRAFPVVGEPGADRILMMAGLSPVLGLDANAVRVLLRLGYGKETGNFARDYGSARDAAARRIPEDPGHRARAFLLLKRHGKETCRRSRPACPTCPVRNACAYFKAMGNDPGGGARI